MLFLILISFDSLSSEPRCGDGICHPKQDYLSCPVDCTGFEVDMVNEIKIIHGESITIPLQIRQFYDVPIEYNISSSSNLEDFLNLNNSSIMFSSSGTHLIELNFNSSENYNSRSVLGDILVETEYDTISIEVFIEVINQLDREISLSSDLYSDTYSLGEDMNYFLNVDFFVPFNSSIDLEILATPVTSDQVFILDNFTLNFSNSYRGLKTISLDKNLFTSNDTGLILGRYNLITNLIYNGTLIQSKSVFTLKQNFFNTIYFRILLSFILGVPVFIISFKLLSKYKKYRQEKKRYITPNIKDLPNKSMDTTLFDIGRLAGKRNHAYIAARDLTTHGLVAGSTGSGKSVSASIIVEEALNEKIPVVVFDPTSQWTGFLSSLKDENIFKYYPKFNLKKEDARSYKGLIFTPKDSDFELNFDEYLNPGEITVFNLANLNIKDYDRAVSKIINKIFDKSWEEDPELKLLCVFDEVHRLLDPNCSGEGYKGLIKGAREFRKWGIGLLMASQVSSDFKEEIGGNVLTEIQLNTKNMNDIKKASEKYGEMFAKRITRQGVGVALVQNPKYNDGNPWFIHFRPPFHNPHKLSEEDLKAYDKYTSELKSIKQKLESKKQSGDDISDLELDYNLANNKLKEGRFKMTDIYIQSIKEKLGLK
ncbi:MAG: ATP-binding protein [Candidatus Woesearchaeota archaeon]